MNTNEIANRLYDLVPDTKRNDDILQAITIALKNFDDKYIANTILYINKKNPHNYAAYLNSALKNHYIDSVVNNNSTEKSKQINNANNNGLDKANSLSNINDKQQINDSNIAPDELKDRIHELEEKKYNITVKSSWLVEKGLIDDFNNMSLDGKMKIIGKALNMLSQLNNIYISISEFNNCSNLDQIKEKLKSKADIITRNMLEVYLLDEMHELLPDRIDEIKQQIANQLSKIDSEIEELKSKTKSLL